jgi:hypothetical protein
VFPVTVVDPEVDDPHPPHRFYNHEDEHIYKLCELFVLFFSSSVLVVHCTLGGRLSSFWGERE